MSDIAIKIDHVSKEYRLGAIGGTTLREEFHRLADKFFHRESMSSDFGKKFMALQDINLEVRKGERLGIIGHNGAGKSTLLKLLARVTGPTTGTIAYNGRISSMLEVGTGFHGELTGRENIYMNGAILGMSKREIDSKIDQIIEFAEMEKFIDTPVKRYSSGMYVKLAFAVAAHLDNEILIMDEVLAVGDMKFQQKCLGKMGDSSRVEGKTVLYVSHNMGTIRQLCSRCIVLNHGKKIFDGGIEEGISYYLEAGKLDFKRLIDTAGIVRPAWHVDKDMKILSIEFLNNDVLNVGRDEPLIIRMKIHSEHDRENVCLRVTLRSMSGTGIGGCLTGHGERFATGISFKTYRLVLPQLLYGSYKLDIALYEASEGGGLITHDFLRMSCGFNKCYSIEDTGNLVWDPNDWGYVKLSDIESL